MYIYLTYGRTGFPEDMLRYDRATVLKGPLNHDQLPKSMTTERFKNPHWKFYIICSETEPTTARWQSFLWNVVPLVKLNDDDAVLFDSIEEAEAYIKQAVENRLH